MQKVEQFPKSFWHGRIGRMNFFLRWLAATIIGGILEPIVADANVIAPGVGIVLVSLALVSIALSINAFIRRVHDRNHSGWCILISLIPLVNLYFFFYLLFARGTRGDNKYGPCRRSFMPIDGEHVKQAANASKDALSDAASQLKRSADALSDAADRLQKSPNAK